MLVSVHACHCGAKARPRGSGSQNDPMRPMARAAIRAETIQQAFLRLEQTMKAALTFTAALLVSVGMARGQAVTESKTIGGKTIVITYSSPKVNNRVGKLFGKDGRIGQDSTYPVWRAGAHAATKFHTEAGLYVGAVFVPKGD